MSWSFTVAGNGPKGERSYNVGVETEFNAAAGQAKIVFAPVIVEVQEVEIIENGKVIGVGSRQEPLENPHLHPGAKLLKTTEGIETADATGDLFPLKDDASGAEEGYTFKVERQNGLSLEIGFKALGMNHTLAGRAYLKEAATFSCSLIGGHDYRLFRTRGVTGVSWRVE